ncbi:steroidogenic acute regulatory protein-like [Leptinotarsa decemlineata]|uniref:steroidogenic acute regulatory protein-like n=1 Tax=Leptinotarsa decemlineata TaxID=7539 RepID=UPI003D308D79
MSTPVQENNFNYNNSPNQNAQSPLEFSYSHSVNTISSVRDYIISEDLMAGQRLDGRMSNVRRFFCLFVTFDFLFTSLMWLICVMLNGEYIVTALSEQVIHYNIHTSLFDIVSAAFLRFSILIVFYAFFYINHWIVISLSTASTCVFLIAKVFYYDWPHSSQPVFEVLLVLVSFILAWGEAWFLDFKVIPQEVHASRFLTSAESERAPLIRSYVQGLPSLYTDSIGNFYSPRGSPEGSMYRFEQTPNTCSFLPVSFSRDQEEKYKILANKTLQEAWELFQMKDWKVNRQNENDIVFSGTNRNGKKIFKLKVQLDTSPDHLLEELFFRIQDLPKWNTAIKESQKIQSFDEHTDITYQISKDAARGLVSSRDFVNLRHWSVIDKCQVICNYKTEHPSVPVNDKIVRGENGVGCYVIEPTEDTHKCILYWIVDIDLKMWIPSQIFEKEMAQMMFKFTDDLRNHISSKKTQEVV